MLHLSRRNEVHTGIWWGKRNEKDHSEGIGVDGKVILKWILKFVW